MAGLITIYRYLVLEHCGGGELFEYLIHRGRLPEYEAVDYFRQVLSGLSYCHRFNICHRDLKPENLLLDDTKKIIKIADFGMAALNPEGTHLDSSCGSPHYAAPEIIKGKPYVGQRADIWSLGVILYALLTGFLPFDDDNVVRLLERVKKGSFTMPHGVSSEAKDLIWRMLQVNPKHRIETDDIWDHPLLKKYDSFSKAGRLEHKFDRFAGCPPPITPEEVGHPVTRRKDIDHEILRNMCTLWHKEQEDMVIERLLAPV
jgi:serine/threonine-protein kinase HSL1, negative regulator of Swe1 kinase